MAEQYTPNIGELCQDDARRDAIHFAVAPVVAGEDLQPGDHVGFRDDSQKAYWMPEKKESSIGIVDPFLGQQVAKDQRFWLFLYPGTITGLRHVWSHRAFQMQPPKAKGEKAS